MKFADAVAAVQTAGVPGDLFGGADAAHTYRTLARVLHPDTVPPARTTAATAAFIQLTRLWTMYQREHRLGGGGGTLTTSRHQYVVGDLVAEGDLCNLFRVTFDGREGLLKMPRRPGDSDLMAREAQTLRTFEELGDAAFSPYVPKLIESFTHRDGAVQRTVNVLEWLPDLVSLATVAKSFPDGLDPRDVAWMWRRLLVALGHAHRVGALHCAVLPEHILIQPEQHGLVLVDWCYSVGAATPNGVGESVRALVGRYRDWYPPEVPDKRSVGVGTDIYLATECMRRLMGDQAHPRLLAFVRGCMLPDQRRRPQDAWRLLGEFDELIEELYGPRQFRPFALPR